MNTPANSPRSGGRVRPAGSRPTGRILASGTAWGVLFVTGAAMAQVQSPDAPAMQEIVVTGTSIKGVDAETALPVQVLKRDDIERTGATSVEQLFQQISAASSAGTTVAAQANGVTTGAISTISLRGLGSARTLVLINGQRSAVYGGGSAGTAGNSVDISAIPLAAIERVEILKDGASAIYGSDAIAGVVNFILRTDYQGLEINAGGGTPTRGGGAQEEHASIYGGFGDLKTDRYNVTAGFNFEHSSALAGADRGFASRYNPQYGNDNTSSFAFPANVAVPGVGTRNPLVGGCGPASLNDANYSKQCRFDNSPYDSLEPRIEKLSAYLSASFALNDSATLYSEGSYSRVKTTTTTQPVPLSYANPILATDSYYQYLANLLATQYPAYKNPAVAAGTGAFLLPPTSPYYPTAFAAANGINGQPLNLIYRDFANGLRSTLDVADTGRVVGGVKGNVGGWDYDAAILFSVVTVSDNLEAGYALYSKMMPLLDSGVIDPFANDSSPAALAAAAGDTFVGQDYSTRTSITSVNGSLSRKLLDLPAGALKAALGAEVRRETFDYNPSSVVQAGDVAGLGGSSFPESAARNVESAFLEVNVPVVQGLDADAAVRFDNYQGVGHTVNPKGSIRWQVEPWLLLRTSAGSGFRAPSLTDLYAAQATSVTSNGTRDPIQCPTFNANNPACSFQFTTTTGGNPNLKPERSQTITLGTVIQPVANLSMDFDSFWIYLQNQIQVGGLSSAYILQNAQTATQYANFITRNAAGQIVSINQTNANLFKAEVSGLDTDIKYAIDLGDAGRLRLVADGTYYYRYVTQNPDGSYTSQVDVGTTNAPGLVSRFRYTATAIYDFGPWDASVTQNWQKKYHDVASSVTGVSREVSAYDTVDAQVSYTGLSALKVTLGARNVFDKNPPYANYGGVANNFIGGYDISYGDPRGRFVYVDFSYKVR